MSYSPVIQIAWSILSNQGFIQAVSDLLLGCNSSHPLRENELGFVHSLFTEYSLRYCLTTFSILTWHLTIWLGLADEYDDPFLRLLIRIGRLLRPLLFWWSGHLYGCRRDNFFRQQSRPSLRKRGLSWHYGATKRETRMKMRKRRLWGRMKINPTIISQEQQQYRRNIEVLHHLYCF